MNPRRSPLGSLTVASPTTVNMPICGTAPELWFADDPTNAIQLCCTCQLITQCLNAALAREGTVTAQYRFGVWGGLTPQQRETLAVADRRNHRRVGAA